MNKALIKKLAGEQTTIYMEGLAFNWSSELPSQLQATDIDATLVLGADILFFRDYHIALSNLLKKLLRGNLSKALIISPDRSGTRSEFETILKKSMPEMDISSMNVTEVASGMQEIKNKHIQDNTWHPDKHDLVIMQVTLSNTVS